MKSVVLLIGVVLAPALHAEALRIGDINSYRAFPAHLEPYRKGWMLAQEQINAAGGVDGRRIVVVSRDAGTSSDSTARAAQGAMGGNVHVLMGGFSAPVSSALAQYAARRKLVYVATGLFADDSQIGKGDRYTFRLRPSASMQAAMLIPEALKLRKNYWAIVYPHTAHDYEAVKTFKALLQKAQPSAVFVLEQAVPLGQLDAMGLMHQLFDAQPQAIFSSLFGTDLRDFVAAGSEKRLFRHVEVVNLLAGQPEDLALLKETAPDGWWVTGYPWNDIDYPPHKRFVAAYAARWKEPPRAGSLIGYIALTSIAQATRRAKSSQAEKLVQGFEGLETLTPLGVIEWRKSDHRSTMGSFVGQLRNKGKEAVMVRWRFEPGADHLPAEH
jgi:branched-chain amino acid transport system substrate-binding protein